MKLSSLLIPLVFTLLLFGCSESGDSQPSVPPPTKQGPPQFVKADDAKIFFENYLKDLSSETYFPLEMVTELSGRTSLPSAVVMIERHNTIPFIEWYYSPAYLDQIKRIVDKKVANMDYQLKILDVPKADATKVIFVTDVGPLEHRKVLQRGAFNQQWEQKDENTYALLLSEGAWQQALRVVRVQGAWKLEIAGF